MMDGCLLIVAADRELRARLCSFLQGAGFRVLPAGDSRAGLQLAYEHHPEAVLLQLELPGLDGCQVCARLRELSTVPILVLANCSEPENAVACLTAGADDFVCASVDMHELEARVRALLRRATSAEVVPGAGYDDGRLRIDPRGQTVWSHGTLIHLSPTESRLLCALVRAGGRVVPHEDLLSEVWGPHCLENPNYLSIYVRYLRRKLEDDPENPHYIQTKWGVGYRFVPNS